jgi:hypothetical protein
MSGEEPDKQAVQGVQLKRNNPLLSPKFNQMWRDRQQEELEHYEQ